MSSLKFKMLFVGSKAVLSAGSSSFREFKSLLSRRDAVLTKAAALVEAHSGICFSEGVQIQAVTKPAMLHK